MQRFQDEIYLFNTGEAQRAYRMLGCRFDAQRGMHRFMVYAPHAREVSVVGSFNGWDASKHPMWFHQGIWTAYIPEAVHGDLYKYSILGADGRRVCKADPFALHAEVRPKTASKVWDIAEYRWRDQEYLVARAQRHSSAPISVLELHVGSWRKKAGYDFVSLREIAAEVADYVRGMGYTHVELMPMAEHPLDASWGYQVTGYYAVTSRYGTPEDMMYFVDTLHAAGIGVILDWVPAHFPKDEHGLYRFDGDCLYEYADPLIAEHPHWGTVVFDYGRPQVQSFLVSNAVFWLDVYHIDGLRMDAVSSMLYLDYGRESGNYKKNQYGGNHNLEAIALIKKANATVKTLFPGAVTIAEESSSFAGVTAPVEQDGLGFTYKWNMGYMNDTLRYFREDPLFRKYHHHLLTFSMVYAFSEQFILAYSHDEVVHQKGAMIAKMPGDNWQKFANLRLLFGYQFAHPGKKHMFMGSEFAQFREWNENQELDWYLLAYPMHQGMQAYVKALNAFYRSRTSMYEQENWQGFRWLVVDDTASSVAAFLRIAKDGQTTVCLFNMTPIVRHNYPISLPHAGVLRELLNSDAVMFGGSGVTNETMAVTEEKGFRAHVTFPPLAAVYLDFSKE